MSLLTYNAPCSSLGPWALGVRFFRKAGGIFWQSLTFFHLEAILRLRHWNVATQSKVLQVLGLVFGRTDFSRIFMFGPPVFFRGFCRQFFSPHFREKKSPEILQENPRQNPPKFIQQKSPTHFCRGAGPTSKRGAL